MPVHQLRHRIHRKKISRYLFSLLNSYSLIFQPFYVNSARLKALYEDLHDKFGDATDEEREEQEEQKQSWFMTCLLTWIILFDNLYAGNKDILLYEACQNFINPLIHFRWRDIGILKNTLLEF